MRSSSVCHLFFFIIQLQHALTTSPWSPPSTNLVHAKECNALLQFQGSFTINPKIQTVYYCRENYMNLTSHPTTASWMEGVDCCTWDGITCDNTTGNVIKLDLTCSYLQGTLLSISTLLALPSLQYLNIGGNNLTREIPSSLCQKSSLTHLALSDNDLSGNIPPCFGNLSNLLSLHIRHNRIGGLLPRSLANCTRLCSLYINANEINDTFPYWLKTLPLRSLLISNNYFHGLIDPDPQAFPFPHLEDFIIDYNNLLGQLPPTYFLNSSLNIIDMSYNQFDGEMPIPAATTYFFHISNNNFTGKIPPFMCNSTNLNIIGLSSNALTGNIPRCLINTNPQLVELNLRMNSFQGLISEISAPNISLKAIALTDNQLGGKLPRSLANCKNLEVLDLGGNQIEDSFPNWLESLPNLRVLVLRSNKLHGLISSPASINPFPKLHILDVSNNDLRGTLPTQYMANFKDMMSGDRGHGFFNYSSGKVVTADSASIVGKGAYMDMIRVQKSFVAIDLSRNQFQGELPEVLGNLRSLIGLNFSHNKLSSIIPSSLGNLTNLEWLDLSANSLIGEIPGALANLAFLSLLNLSNNQLEGPIPRGKQFETFTANSFDGNIGLCGMPLATVCGEDANKSPSSASHEVEEDRQHGSWIDRQAAMMGYGCGTVVGISVGQIILPIGKPLWLMKIMERMTYRLKNRARRSHGRIRAQPMG